MAGRSRSLSPTDDVDSRRGGFAKTLRWLGVLLPLVLSYPLLPVYPFGAWFRPRVLATAALWLVVAAMLLVRRDWRGAAAITAMYVVVDAWWMGVAYRRLRTEPHQATPR